MNTLALYCAKVFTCFGAPYCRYKRLQEEALKPFENTLRVYRKRRSMNLVTPAGFRDVLPLEAKARESLMRSVQDCFQAAGYDPIETPTLEVFDVVKAGAHVPASPFKLFDARGDLLALRPDVTLQVARICASRLKESAAPLKFRYTQRVFREAEEPLQAQAREFTQMGVECIGVWSPTIDAELIELAAKALHLAGVSTFTIALATVSVLRSILDCSQAPDVWKEAVLNAYHDSDFVALEELCGPNAPVVDHAYAQAIQELRDIRGGSQAICQVRELVEPLGCGGDLDAFEQTYHLLEAAGLGEQVLIDFSVVSSFDYYTGMVFQVYAPLYGSALVSGGRYDHMVGAYGHESPAAGFAFSLENVMAVASMQEALCEDLSDASSSTSSRSPLRIAVPKGSLNADAIAALAGAGLDVADLEHPGRALIIHGEGVDYIIVRPSDAPAFVALGAADCGICGEDSLLEANVDVVKLADLHFGACRFVVAEPAGAQQSVEEHYRRLGSIRVATKYPRITAAHYAQSGMQVEIVVLHGNIELAPLTGLAERIVDITATGTTLAENNLIIVDEVLQSTARFFANGASLRTDERVADLARKIKAYTDMQDYKPIAGATK